MRTYYRYATLMRPAGPGAVPKAGLVACEDCYGFAPSGHRIYSIVDYDRPLTDDETRFYEMEYCHKLEVVTDE